jgi:hypothetical protein
MATIERIDQELTKADARLDEATKNLENFMKEENLEKFEKRWGTEAMKEEKKSLEEKERFWRGQVEEWGKKLREFGGGEGNEQIA